ncbi:carboxypeptidase-like regulatory domain-containing protein, partial [Zoogloea sp.]|uniref:carboxypeptidase-like regulatory domain-containing protein n=1 Tax=Zoogloea sp. TaxID=49181 RepID=UPI0025EE210F
MEHRIRMRAIALAVGSTLILAACGGSGSSNHSVSGIAAEGLAIANAVVTVKDAAGTTRSVTTDASGNYVFDTS